MTLGEMLKASAEAAAKKPAIIFNEQTISYSQLYEKARALACGLIKLGLTPGDNAAILLSNSPEYIISAFGISIAGGVIIPINCFLAPPEAAYILEDSEAVILISSAEYTAQIDACRRLDYLKHIILCGEDNAKDIIFEGLLQSDTTGEKLPQIDSEADALIIYTSGTTGHPKGAVLTNHNLISNITACCKVIKVTAKDRFLVFLPLFHSFTFTVTILLPCYMRARIILLPGINRKEIKKAIICHKISVFVGIPAVYNLFSQLKISWLARWLNPVRIYISGGAPLSKAVLEKFQHNFRRPLLEGYGLSEASPVVSINPIHKTKPCSVGLPLPGVTVKAVDERGNNLPNGEVGELLVKGANVMRGYLNRPQATKCALKGGWLHTGDLAHIDNEGYIYIVERKKDMLIVHGINVYPREIEEVLNRHPQIAEVAVVGVRDAHKGELPKAVIVLKDGERLTVKEIKQYCKDFLAGYKTPKIVEFRESLPKTATGKIIKRML